MSFFVAVTVKLKDTTWWVLGKSGKRLTHFRKKQCVCKEVKIRKVVPVDKEVIRDSERMFATAITVRFEGYYLAATLQVWKEINTQWKCSSVGCCGIGIHRESKRGQ